MYRELENLANSELYPFHMPGHKRMSLDSCLDGALSIDITEIDDFDNMHHSEGIIKELEIKMAEVFGGKNAYILVNGSTSGILSAISSCTTRGGKILMSRNSHKSAYNAAFLNELDVRYLYPTKLEPFGINGGIRPEDVCEALRADTDIEAVFITSPTYEGVISDVRGISEACHDAGVPLIVDSAHGAHLGLFEKFSKEYNADAAIKCGADIVICSLHKTLPSFTQTAMVLVDSKLIDIEKFKMYYSIFQTSSPSYVFMAGIDKCVELIKESGQERYTELDRRLTKLRAKKYKNINIFGPEYIGKDAVYGFDVTKLCIAADGLSGKELYDRLRCIFHLQCEMAMGSYALLMTTLMDTDDGFNRLEMALERIDEDI